MHGMRNYNFQIDALTQDIRELNIQNSKRGEKIQIQF